MGISNAVANFGYNLIDNGAIPDWILRPAIRHLCRIRLSSLPSVDIFTVHTVYKSDFIAGIKKLPSITAAGSEIKANEQHYEVSTAFILSCLGPRAKYSGCLFEKEGSQGVVKLKTLAEAEDAMLELYCSRASLKDGMEILDLGCGWGSLSLYLAEKYPNAKITGLSNSATQKAHIDSVALKKNLNNVAIITGDVNTFDFEENRQFDRILSIEMFEHMKNYELLLRKISSWLKPTKYTIDGSDALLFIHIFCHKTTPYHFEDDDSWMARTFFSGGTMGSYDLLLHFQSDVTLLQSWWVNGKHYGQTSEAWLKMQDKNTKQAIKDLERDAVSKGLSKEEGRKAFYRFRVFFLAVAEFFALNNGEEWGVGHYLFKRKAESIG